MQTSLPAVGTPFVGLSELWVKTERQQMLDNIQYSERQAAQSLFCVEIQQSYINQKEFQNS